MGAAAVSPVTSYLAIEPGVRPSTEGFEEEGGGGAGLWRLGVIGHGSGGGGIADRMHDAFDALAWMREALGRAWKDCGGAGRTATLTVETTLDEVVDVHDIAIGGSKTGRECLREAAWRLDLPEGFVQELQVLQISL